MPRLFTGIEIPDDLRRRLSFLRGGLPGARWIDAENYHLTLRFVGDIDLRTANEIAEALDRVHRPAFPLIIDGLGSFGGRKPHAIIANVRPSRELAELQAEHERLMQRLGLAPETRKFTPHITLARLRGTSVREAADYLALRGGFADGPYFVSRFVLFSARDAVGGGPYVVEESYPLVARAA
ncbi:MAG: RNA 2',3'-cyclic phosphodiesterase [Bauldia sp.]